MMRARAEREVERAAEDIGFGMVRTAVRAALELGVDREVVKAAVADAFKASSTWEPPLTLASDEEVIR